MKIVFTEILDLSDEKLDDVKINFANNIIQTFKPLLNRYDELKIKKIVVVKKEIKKIKERTLLEKKELEKSLVEHRKQIKISKLLERIDRVINYGLSYGSTKRELIVILKILNKLTEEKIETQINNVMLILSKSINKDPVF